MSKSRARDIGLLRYRGNIGPDHKIYRGSESLFGVRSNIVCPLQWVVFCGMGACKPTKCALRNEGGEKHWISQ